jgi:hypothetical protein
MKFQNEIRLVIEYEPSPRVRASKHTRLTEKLPMKYGEQKFWKRAKSIAIQKQSRQKNQFEESEPIFDICELAAMYDYGVFDNKIGVGELGAGW